MTFKDWFIVILTILMIPLEFIWKVLCIVPAILVLPVCLLLDHVEHKRGNQGYAVTGMVGFMARSAAIPRKIYMRIIGMKDYKMERYLEDIRDMEEKGL